MLQDQKNFEAIYSDRNDENPIDVHAFCNEVELYDIPEVSSSHSEFEALNELLPRRSVT